MSYTKIYNIYIYNYYIYTYIYIYCCLFLLAFWNITTSKILPICEQFSWYPLDHQEGLKISHLNKHFNLKTWCLRSTWSLFLTRKHPCQASGGFNHDHSQQRKVPGIYRKGRALLVQGKGACSWKAYIKIMKNYSYTRFFQVTFCFPNWITRFDASFLLPI